ncbi:MAG: GTP pyrophosphokinase [Solirubrobacteraceae bacterium]
MDAAAARKLARLRHGDQRDRFGGLEIDHLERVAASVKTEARAVALLHDLLEHTSTSVQELEAHGLTAEELTAVLLLTRRPAESFELHALRIAQARGPAARLARMVKLADIDDHLESERGTPSTRPYKWARSHVAACQARFDLAPRAVSAA